MKKFTVYIKKNIFTGTKTILKSKIKIKFLIINLHFLNGKTFDTYLSLVEQ